MNIRQISAMGVAVLLALSAGCKREEPKPSAPPPTPQTAPQPAPAPQPGTGAAPSAPGRTVGR